MSKSHHSAGKKNDIEMSFLSYDQALACLLRSKVNLYLLLYNRTIPDKLIKEKHGWTDLPTSIKGFNLEEKIEQTSNNKKKRKRERNRNVLYIS